VVDSGEEPKSGSDAHWCDWRMSPKSALESAALTNNSKLGDVAVGPVGVLTGLPDRAALH